MSRLKEFSGAINDQAMRAGNKLVEVYGGPTAEAAGFLFKIMGSQPLAPGLRKPNS